LYEVSYRAKDPLVLGIGLAAIRDVASFFRYEARDDAGTPNPVAGAMKWAIGHGTSQSGNALKTFLLQGFNQDEAAPHRVRRRQSAHRRSADRRQRTLRTAERFRHPVRAGGEGALWWTPYRDIARGRPEASLLDRCRRQQHLPEDLRDLRRRRIQCPPHDGGPHRYRRQGRPAAAAERAPLLLPGTTHGGDDQGGFAHARQRSPHACCRRIPIPRRNRWRRSRTRWCRWVTRGVEPPPSSYPRLANGDLAANTARAMGWPAIPDVPGPDGMAVGLMDYDYGPELRPTTSPGC
jgi:hypothetical protein